RCLAAWRIATPPNIGVDQSSFIAPVDLGVFGLGALGNGRVIFIQPLFDCRWGLFVGPLNRFLRGEPPTLQIGAYRSGMQLDTELLFDEMADGNPRPQSKFHFQLLRAFVADQL